MNNYDRLNLLPEPITNLTRTAVQYYNSCIKEKELTATALYLVCNHLSQEEHNIISPMIEKIVARDLSASIMNLHTWSFEEKTEEDQFYSHIMQSDIQTLISVLDFYNHPSSRILKSILETKKQQEGYND